MVKMPSEHHKETTLQHLRRLDGLQRWRDKLPGISSASNIQLLAPACSPLNVISTRTRRINLQDTEPSYFPTQKQTGQDNLGLVDIQARLSSRAGIKANVADSLRGSSLEEAMLHLNLVSIATPP